MARLNPRPILKGARQVRPIISCRCGRSNTSVRGAALPAATRFQIREETLSEPTWLFCPRCGQRRSLDWRSRSIGLDHISAGRKMAQSEIDTIRALLGSKPRPVGWNERRQRLDDVGSIWPAADDVRLTAVDAGGVPGEWSSVPGSEATRVLMFFHGGGYCSGSIRSHRRMVSEAGRAAAA